MSRPFSNSVSVALLTVIGFKMLGLGALPHISDDPWGWRVRMPILAGVSRTRNFARRFWKGVRMARGKTRLYRWNSGKTSFDDGRSIIELGHAECIEDLHLLPGKELHARCQEH